MKKLLFFILVSLLTTNLIYGFNISNYSGFEATVDVYYKWPSPDQLGIKVLAGTASNPSHQEIYRPLGGIAVINYIVANVKKPDGSTYRTPNQSDAPSDRGYAIIKKDNKQEWQIIPKPSSWQ